MSLEKPFLRRLFSPHRSCLAALILQLFIISGLGICGALLLFMRVRQVLRFFASPTYAPYNQLSAEHTYASPELELHLHRERFGCKIGSRFSWPGRGKRANPLFQYGSLALHTLH